jgi:preprotein translocase subunit SecE
MGRLPRKKTVVQKSKKKKINDGNLDGQDSASPKVLSSNDVVPNKQQQILPTKKELASHPKKQDAFFVKWLQFLKEVKVELKKVVWPSRKQTAASTLVVVVLVVILSLFLGLVDVGLSSLIRFVFS